MVQVKDRIESRGVGIRHQPGQVRIVRIAAADEDVHLVVRLRFEPPVHRPAVREAGVDAPEAGVAAAGHAGVVGIVQRVEVHLVEIDEDVAVIVRPIALRDEKRIVALAVRPVP